MNKWWRYWDLRHGYSGIFKTFRSNQFGEQCWRVGHFSSSQLSPELNDEELLLELPLSRLRTDGATAIEVGGDIVRSAVGAPGKLPKAPHARAPSNNANTAMKRLNSTLQRDSPKRKKILNLEGWGRCDISLVSQCVPRRTGLQECRRDGCTDLHRSGCLVDVGERAPAIQSSCGARQAPLSSSDVAR